MLADALDMAPDVRNARLRKRRRARNSEGSESFAEVRAYNIDFYEQRFGDYASEPQGWINDNADEVRITEVPRLGGGGGLSQSGIRHAAPMAMANPSDNVPMEDVERMLVARTTSAAREDTDYMCVSSCSEDDEVLRFERRDPMAASTVDSSIPGVSRSRRGAVTMHRQPDQCFRCSFSDRNYDAVYAQDVRTLMSIYEKGIGHAKREHLAKQVHLYFKHHIYLPMQRAGKRVPMWRTRTILEHMNSHDNEPRLFISQTISHFRSNFAMLRSMQYKRDPETGALEPNIRNQQLAERSANMILKMYKADATKMNFYDDAAQYDLGAASRRALQNTGIGTYRVTRREMSAVYRRGNR